MTKPKGADALVTTTDPAVLAEECKALVNEITEGGRVLVPRMQRVVNALDEAAQALRAQPDPAMVEAVVGTCAGLADQWDMSGNTGLYIKRHFPHALSRPSPATTGERTGRERLAEQVGVALANSANLPDPLIATTTGEDAVKLREAVETAIRHLETGKQNQGAMVALDTLRDALLEQHGTEEGGRG